MKEPIALVIMPDTPESLTECMDDYTRDLLKAPWWDFATKRFLRNWIIGCHRKRLKLLDDRKFAAAINKTLTKDRR